MSHRYDAILKHLPEDFPHDWAVLEGVERSTPVRVIDADISTVTAAADKVLLIEEQEPWILHLEFQASYDPNLNRRLLHYNVLLGIRHSLPVRTVVFLLRPEADGKNMTGHVQFALPKGKPYLEFDYEVVRVWQLEPAAILAAGIGTLPLLPLTGVEKSDLPQLIREMASRIDRQTGKAEADSIWTATFVLMGLQYDEEFASQLLQGVRAMKESVTYQAILREGREEGRVEEARRMLLMVGTRHLGEPTAAERQTIASIKEPVECEALTNRSFDVENWAELLAEL